MLEAATQGLILITQWPAIGYLVLGVLIGLCFGAIPGLSGLVGMAILLPFTFSMDSVSAFAFLIGMFAVTTTADTIASVLLGIPGTAASQATILDGYPLAMRGEAARAFGAAFTVSALGGVIGAVFLAFSIPVVRPLILSFASPEFFLLGVLGLTMVGALSGGSILKGLVGALFGLMLSMIGYGEMGALPRYHFGINYLLDGIPLIPLVLGLFAFPELLDLATRNGSISRVARNQVIKGMMHGVRDAFRHWLLVLRCSAIGIYVGILPGLGGAIVDWVAYGHAVQMARDRSKFGKGDIRGVIAPETANNAMKGGALIPTVAFGIPGSAPMAILLGAFAIQGLTPGPSMLTTELYLTFSLIWALVFANILGAALLMIWANQLARATFIRGHLVVPCVVLFVFMGAWMSGNQWGDWGTLLTFGVLGYLLKQAGVSRPALILGFILGPIMENALFITNQAYGSWLWLLRPVSLVILCVIVAILIGSTWFGRRRREAPESVEIGEDTTNDRLVSFPLLAVLLAGFLYTTWQAFDWYIDAAFFPIAIGLPAILLTGAALLKEMRSLRQEEGREGGVVASLIARSPTASEFPESLRFFAWLGAILLVSELLGQRVALPLFILLYLRFWGSCTWRFSAIYAAAGLVLLEVMFDKVVHVVWHTPLLADWIKF